MQIKWSPKLIDDNGRMWKKKGDVWEESEWWRWQISMFYVLESFVNMWQGVFSLWWNLFFFFINSYVIFIISFLIFILLIIFLLPNKKNFIM